MPSEPLAPFSALFGRPASITARAPGRVNLIGEHTDYSEGFVLPAAIPRETIAEIAPRGDRRVRGASANAEGAPVEYQIGGEARTGGWADYLQGVTAVLGRAGHLIGGFDLRVSSTVPLGAGLSSSASFELAVLRALRAAFALPIDDVELARLGQRVETDFVGAPIGIMDQMAASLADRGTALFIDTRTLAFERLPLPEAADLVIINSGVTHSHAGGEYRTRRAECERAAAALGVRVLRDVSPDDLERVEALPEPLRRRARHVVTENVRVQKAVQALRAQDLEELGRLFNASHESLRKDFEVSVAEVDLLVELARGETGVFGARITGGGFGGCIVALAAKERAAVVGQAVARAYEARTGRSAMVVRLREESLQIA